MGEEQPYIKSGENAGKWIENANNSSKKQNTFFRYHNIFTCYLAVTNYNKTFSLNDFKSEIDGVLLPPFWLYAFSSISPMLSP